MKAHTASLINAITLIGLGGWGYLGSDEPSVTALIPVIAGVLLIAMNGGVKQENKTVAHIAVLLTLLVEIGLFMPLLGALERNDTEALIRVVIMIATCSLAMAFFVKSFIDARKRREAAGA